MHPELRASPLLSRLSQTVQAAGTPQRNWMWMIQLQSPTLAPSLWSPRMMQKTVTTQSHVHPVKPRSACWFSSLRTKAQDYQEQWARRCCSRTWRMSSSISSSLACALQSRVSWCFLKYTKPNSTQAALRGSVYSSWCVNSYNPNPLNLSTKAALALLRSKQRSNTDLVYTTSAMSPPSSGKLVSSVAWKLRFDQVNRNLEKTTQRHTREKKTFCFILLSLLFSAVEARADAC